jgi:hypothetical protein
MKQKDDSLYLRHILDAISTIGEYLTDKIQSNTAAARRGYSAIRNHRRSNQKPLSGCSANITQSSMEKYGGDA